MLDFTRSQRRLRGRKDPHAWIPEAVTALVLGALALAVAAFLRVLYALRGRLAEENPAMLWAFLGGFCIIELYLLRRTWKQIQKARELRRSSGRSD